MEKENNKKEGKKPSLSELALKKKTAFMAYLGEYAKLDEAGRKKAMEDLDFREASVRKTLEKAGEKIDRNDLSALVSNPVWLQCQTELEEISQRKQACQMIVKPDVK